MTVDRPADLRSRLYEAYGTPHSGCGGDGAAISIYRRDYAAIMATDLLKHFTEPEALQTFHDTATALAPDGADLVLARSSPLVTHVLASAARVTIQQVVGACYWIALAAETGMLHGHIVTQNLTFADRRGVVSVRPAVS